MRAAVKRDSRTWMTASAGASEPLAQAVDELAIVRWKIVDEAVDRFNDDAPLRKTGDGTERVESRLEFDRDADTELRVILDSLAFSGAGRRSTGTTTSVPTIDGHGQLRWRCVVEMYRLRCTSD